MTGIPDPLPLAHLPTPMEPMDRLADHLGLPTGTIWVKRDDCTGLAGGGNKARKLAYLCADARNQECDVLVTGGGRQSNHVRMTAAAASKLGMDAVLVMASDEPDRPTGNVVLDHLFGPTFVWAGPLDYYALEARIVSEVDRLKAAGRRPYLMPIGGASIVGALGYVAAVDEMREQLPRIDLVVTADGSGGTHAGLVAGLGDHGKVLGVDVGTRPDLAEQVPAKAALAAKAAGRTEPVGRVQLDVDRFGDGYGAPTDSGREALDLGGRLEGLVLDPVYSGKAMAGFIAAVRDGRIEPGQQVVFLHTGGMPALFSSRYATWVTVRP
ncbi:MAG: D-cysteine desulfhydrase family protein [Acidimicrobiales bacterium]